MLQIVLIFTISSIFDLYDTIPGLNLTLKTPRKPASENVVWLYRLPNILPNFSNYFCIPANSVDPDQTALGAV